MSLGQQWFLVGVLAWVMSSALVYRVGWYHGRVLELDNQIEKMQGEIQAKVGGQPTSN